MKCERCNDREAEIHIRHQKGKEIEEHHLCRQCAEQMARDGLIPDMTFDFPVESFLGGLFPVHGQPLPDTEEGHAADEGVTCGRCGLDAASFRKTGKWGCPECFSVFHESVGPLLRKIHGSDVHRGIRPAKACVRESCRGDVDSLRKALREAVEMEEYERAAVLRDKIRETEENNEDGS
jgi:protein arginine kinase activator